MVWTGTHYAVVWTNQILSAIQMRLVDRTGEPAGPVRTLAPATHDNIGLAWNGVDLGVAWDSYDGQHHIEFLRVGASGVPLGTAVRLYTTSNSRPQVNVATSGAEFLVSWQYRNEFVRLARIDAGGQQLGSVVTTTVPNSSARLAGEWTGTDYIIYSGSQLTPVSCGCTTTDLDGDNLTSCDGDCDDSSAATFPGAPASCDGINNDCHDAAWPFVAASEFDDDEDTFRVCAGDCDDSDASIYPAAPQLCDGLNNDCDAPGWPDPPADELDVDTDGLLGCAGDCDDSSTTTFPGAPQLCDGINNDCDAPGWPAVPAVEFDSDGDLTRICAGDCDDADPGVHPDATEVCNSLDDDCDALTDEDGLGEDSDGDGVAGLCDNCPQAFNANQFDEDSDGRGNTCDNCLLIPNADQTNRDLDTFGDACDNCPLDASPNQGDLDEDGAGDVCDCAVTDPAVYPGAPEINDGADNQCPGDLGFGAVDETSGNSGFRNAADPTEYSWPEQSGATGYEVARSSEPDFSGSCLTFTTAATSWVDTDLPASTGDRFFYINRPVGPNPGSWGQDSSGIERTAVCP